jgi:hypothetical protein
MSAISSGSQRGATVIGDINAIALYVRYDGRISANATDNAIHPWRQIQLVKGRGGGSRAIS